MPGRNITSVRSEIEADDQTSGTERGREIEKSAAAGRNFAIQKRSLSCEDPGTPDVCLSHVEIQVSIALCMSMPLVYLFKEFLSTSVVGFF